MIYLALGYSQMNALGDLGSTPCHERSILRKGVNFQAFQKDDSSKLRNHFDKQFIFFNETPVLGNWATDIVQRNWGDAL